jgi:ABC-type transporter MlaC component
MIRRKSSIAFTIVLLLLCMARVQAIIAATPAPTDPMNVVKTGIDQVIAVFNDQQMPLNQRREKLQSMSLNYFDFDSMAKSVLFSLH